MLGNVLPWGNVGELASFLDTLDRIPINHQVTKGGLILVECSDSTSGQVVRVGWAKQEDPLGLAQVEAAVGPRGAWAGICEASMPLKGRGQSQLALHALGSLTVQ